MPDRDHLNFDPDDVDALTDYQIDELADDHNGIADSGPPDVLAFADAKACENRRPIDSHKPFGGRKHPSADDRNESIRYFNAALIRWSKKSRIIDKITTYWRRAVIRQNGPRAKQRATESLKYRGEVKADWNAVAFWSERMEAVGLIQMGRKMAGGYLVAGVKYGWYMGDRDDDGGRAA